MKSTISILACLLLHFTMANAGAPLDIRTASPDHDPNHLRKVIPEEAAGPTARLPFKQFMGKNFKAQVSDEVLVGFERKLFGNVFASATYFHQKHNHILDTVPDVMSSDYVCAPVIATNPTTGQNIQTQDCYLPPSVPSPGRTMFLTARGRARSYDGLDMAVAKTVSNHVLLRFSGTIQNQKIHFPDNSINFGRSYQDSALVSLGNENSQARNYVHNLGWDWSIKANVSYLFAHDVTVGAYFEMVNGLMVPIWRESPLFGNYVAERTLPKSSEAPDIASLNAVKYMDLKIQKDFAFGESGKLSISANVFNVFNMNPTQALKGTVQSFQFLEPQAIVNPRVISFEVKYSF